MTKPKAKKEEAVKVEVENIRLSKDYKEGLVQTYCREKFAKKIAELSTIISKELAKEHEKLYPEIKNFNADLQKKWFQTNRKFTIATKRLLGGYKEFFSQDYFPMPCNHYDYRGFVIADPSEKLVVFLNQLCDLEREEDKFKKDFKQLLFSVNTSKQLCELIPELASRFPKRTPSITGSPCTMLVPIELIRSVRASLNLGK